MKTITEMLAEREAAARASRLDTLVCKVGNLAALGITAAVLGMATATMFASELATFAAPAQGAW